MAVGHAVADPGHLPLIPEGTFTSLADRVKRKSNRSELSSYSDCPITLWLANKAGSVLDGTVYLTTAVFDIAIEASPGLTKVTARARYRYVKLARNTVDGRAVFTGRTIGKGQVWIVTLGKHKRVLFGVKPRNSDHHAAGQGDALAAPGSATVLRQRSVRYLNAPSNSLPAIDFCPALAPVAHRVLGTVTTVIPEHHGCYESKRRTDPLLVPTLKRLVAAFP